MVFLLKLNYIGMQKKFACMVHFVDLNHTLLFAAHNGNNLPALGQLHFDGFKNTWAKVNCTYMLLITVVNYLSPLQK